MKIHKNGKKKECREKTKKMKTKEVVGRKKRIRGEAGRKTVKEGFWRGIRKQRGRDERREGGGGGGKGREEPTERRKREKVKTEGVTAGAKMEDFGRKERKHRMKRRKKGRGRRERETRNQRKAWREEEGSGKVEKRKEEEK